MAELIKTWEDREYGPRFAMLAIAAIIIYLELTK